LLREFDENYINYLCIDLGEAEALIQVLESFKEFSENKIGSFESQINSDITKDWNAHKTEIADSQHQRNRDIIEEIVTNTKKFQADNHRKFSIWREADEQDN